MIAYAFLSAGVASAAACAYFVAPAGHGLHRFVMSRGQLRTRCASLEAEAEELACKLIGLASELDGVTTERDDANAMLVKAAEHCIDLEHQLAAFDDLCAENTQLRSDLANAHAVRPLNTGVPTPPVDTASVLPDDVQEFIDQTAAAWRAIA